MISYQVNIDKRIASLLLGFTFIIFMHWRYVNISNANDCKWPPTRPATVSPDVPFDLTLCVRPFKKLVNQSEPIYYLSQLFHLNQRVTFDDLANVKTDLWDLAKYPELFKTYPQNVPLKKLVQRIKIGKRVSHVSYSILKTPLSSNNVYHNKIY